MTAVDEGCALCGLPTPDPPVTDPDVAGGFCCRGCLDVYRVVGDIDPVDARAELGVADVEVPEDAATCHLDVAGMHCTTCAAYLESVARDHDAVYDADASYTTDAVELRYDADETDVSTLADHVSGLGYRAAPADEGVKSSRDAREFARMRVFLAGFLGMFVMGVYAVFLYPAYLGDDWSGLLGGSSAAISLFGPLIGATTLCLLVAGYPVLRGAYVAIKAGYLNMDVLVALGALVPYVYSLVAYFGMHTTVVYFDVTTTIVTVVTLGNYVEDTVKRRALDGVADATVTREREAHRVTADGDTETVPVKACEAGDHVRVTAGERVPVDGTVADGTGVVDESLLTGESRPRTRRPGDDVVGGAALREGEFTVDVAEGAESTLDRIVASMRHVQSASGGAQRLADRLAAAFVPLVVALAVLTAIVWVGAGAGLRPAVLAGVAVLVVSCPCSLGLATPIALVSGVRAAAERGVAVLNTATLEGLADADVVAFDKTGTLTTGEMRVETVVADDATVVAEGPSGSPDGTDPERALLARAAAVESHAEHPIASAVLDAADEVPAATDPRVEGRERGVSAVVAGERVVVGHPDLFEDVEWPASCRDAVSDARNSGALPVVVGSSDAVEGVLVVDDAPRPGWETTLARLGAERDVVVITGDDPSRVGRYEDSDAVDNVLADVPPEAKAELITRRSADATVVMVGDGTNDAPALAAADLGISFAAGTDVALEAADAIVSADALDAVGDAFDVGATTRSRVRQNLGWAFAYNALALPLAAFGLVNPLIASLAMAASSLLVVVNSARSYGDASVDDGDDDRSDTGSDDARTLDDPSLARVGAD